MAYSESKLGIKYRKEVRNGRLVDIDPATNQEITKAARRAYVKKATNELNAKKAEWRKGNRETLASISKAVFPKESELVQRLTRTGPYKLSEVPVSNFAPSTLEAEGLGNKTFLNISEADRLFKRQSLESRINQAQANVHNKKEAAKDISIEDKPWHNPNHPLYNSNEAISERHRLKISKLDPWSVEGLNAKFGKENVISHGAEGIEEVKTPSGDTKVNVDKTLITKTAKEKVGDSLKIQKGIYGMSRKEWAKALKHERKEAKRLSLGKGGVNAPIRE